MSSRLASPRWTTKQDRRNAVEKRILFEFRAAEPATGIKLTESFAMHPAASVSGLYFTHPDSRCFAADRIARDQAEAYARRKGMPPLRSRTLARAEFGV